MSLRSKDFALRGLRFGDLESHVLSVLMALRSAELEFMDLCVLGALRFG